MGDFNVSEADKATLDQMFQAYTDTVKATVAATEAGQKAMAKEFVEKMEKIDFAIEKKMTELQDSQAKTQAELQKNQARLLELEQNGATALPAASTPRVKTFGQMVLESDGFKEAEKHGFPHDSVGKVEVGSLIGYEGISDPFRAQAVAIVNATGLNQPLVEEDRVAGIFIDPAERIMTIRNLLPVQRTTSNLITFVVENVFTNAAAVQGAGSSPQVFENVAKAESGITFTLSNEPVHTLAHWIPASRQVLEDSSMLRGHIDQRLMFGLKQVEETQLLTGSGVGANLNGLQTQATAYDGALDVANDTDIDKLRHAIFQVVRDGEYIASGMVLNHLDWHTIELIKVNAGTDDRYVWSNPAQKNAQRMWGIDVVTTNTQTAGTFLVGAFTLAATIWDRGNATIEVARQHASFFIENMVAILVEERLALTVYRPLALVTGTF